MKKVTLIALSLASLTACKSNDINRVVNDGVDGAINGIFGSSGTVVSATGSGSSNDYSVEKEDICLIKQRKRLETMAHWHL